MRTINQLAGDTASFTSGVGSWTASGGALSNDTSVKLLDDLHTLVATPTNAVDPVTVELSGIPISIGYADSTIQFHARIKSASRVVASVTFTHNQTMPASYEQTRTTVVSANSWVVCRSNMLPIPNIGTSVSATISIEITGHAGEPVSLTLPFLYGTFDVDLSYFTVSTFGQLPQFFRDVERTQAEQNILPEYPMLRLLECGLSTADEVFDDYYRIENVDIETAGQLIYTPTPSLLVSPVGVNDSSAAWLAQFLGFRLDNPQQTTTAWGGLPSTWHAVLTEIDPDDPAVNVVSLARSSGTVTATFAASHSFAPGQTISVVAVDGTATSFSGTFTIAGAPPGTSITWSQSGADETATETHKVGLLDTEWSELEDSNPDFYDRAGYTAWQLENAYSGLRAGSLTALINAAKLNLSGDKIVTVVKRYTGNPWRILIKTKTSETPNGVNLAASEIILNAIKTVKPVGFKVDHQCTANGA